MRSEFLEIFSPFKPTGKEKFIKRKLWKSDNFNEVYQEEI